MPLEGIGITGIWATIIIIVGLWELVWKGFALWKSARNKHLTWFICILIFNTAGILPIIYLLIHRESKTKKMKKK